MSSLDHPWAPGALFGGRYRLERPIARGGMGVVFLAVQEPLGRPVAIKVLQERGLDDTFRERFFAEARISASLSHPNIVTLLDYGEATNGALYMVLEYVEGETLDRVLGREIRLEPTRAISLLRQVASGLQHAHRSGIVHRDLKPGNLIVRVGPEGEQIKILDFGIAKVLSGQVSTRDDLTEASRVLGTPRFMAPEQIRKLDLDGRVDLYALGIIGYMMATGRPPFQADNDTALMNHHLSTDPPSLGERAAVYPELDFVIRRLLAKRREDRPGDASILIEELDAAERALELSQVYVDEARLPDPELRLLALGSAHSRSGAKTSAWLWTAVAAAAVLLVGAVLLRPGAQVESLSAESQARLPLPSPRSELDEAQEVEPEAPGSAVESGHEPPEPSASDREGEEAQAAPDRDAPTETPAPGRRRARSESPGFSERSQAAGSTAGAQVPGTAARSRRPGSPASAEPSATAPSAAAAATGPDPAPGSESKAAPADPGPEPAGGSEPLPESPPESSDEGPVSAPERPRLLLPELERGKSRVPVVE